MKISNLDEYENGWLIGNFVPNLLKSEAFEVAIHKHAAGESSDGHYHAIATEINVVLSGCVKLTCSDEHIIELYEDGIWITYPYENPLVQFLEATKLLVIKTPSVPGDKHYIDKKYPLYPEQLRECRDWTPEDMKAIFGEEYEAEYSNAGSSNKVDK